MEEDYNEIEKIKQKKRNRVSKLGYTPQKELYCNKDLPYSHLLDDESQQMLYDIKESLGRSIALRDMNPGIGIAVTNLMKYIKLFGLKFSKEDHVKFIHILLELMTIEHLEPSKLNKFCLALSSLLRKTDWLSPKDLQIDWKPLYNLSKLILIKNCSKGEMMRYFSKGIESKGNTSFSDMIKTAAEYGFDISSYLEAEESSLEANLQYVIQQCSPYFSKESTQEILDEIYPTLEPQDIGKSSATFDLLSIFLNHMEGHEIWFTHFMQLWDSYSNPPWNVEMMNLISSMSSQNIGLIDWEPYVSVMFTRILRAVDLPVSYKSIKSNRNQNLWASSVVVWIVSTLGPHSSVQDHLTKFLGVLESYLHPANLGKWVNYIGDILFLLPKYFTERLVFERYKKHPWKKQIPDDKKLTEECITKFVESMKVISFRAMYSRIYKNDVSKIFKYLADLRPELIIPDIIDRVYLTLDSVTEPHKMTATLPCLVAVARAMVSGHKGYTQGRTHIIPILFAILPGIDPNDFKKTSVTLHFLTLFALLVPIVDCSKAHLYYEELTDEESLLCEQTADFESFILQFLDRIFVLIEASAVENIRMEQTDFDNARSRLENISEALIHSCSHGILGQCSDEILSAASQKVIDFVKNHILEPKVAGPFLGSLLRVLCRVKGKEMLENIVPYLVETIQKYFDDNENICNLDKQNDEVLYYILLLVNSMKGNPNYTINYIDMVLPIVDQVIKFKCKMATKAIANLLLNLLTNLSTIQSLDIQSLPEAYNKPLKEFLPIRHWGAKMKPDSKINWYVPDETSRQLCEKVIHRYLLPLLESFESFIRNEKSLSRDEIQRDLSILVVLLRCGNFLPNWDDKPYADLIESTVQLNNLNITIGFNDKVIAMPDGSNIRLAVVRTLFKLQDKLLLSCEDDTKSLRYILLVWEKLHCRRHYNTSFDAQMKNYNNTKTFQDYKLTPFKRDVRAITITRVLIQQDCRDELSPPMFTTVHREIMFKILQLGTHRYSDIRALAQSLLFNMFNIYGFAYRCVLDEIVKYLELDAEEFHDSVKGALYILFGVKRMRLIAKHDWDCVEKLWLALLKAKFSEKPSIMLLIDGITDAIHREFPTLTIAINIPKKMIDLGLAILPNQNVLTSTDIHNGLLKLEQKNEDNIKKYLFIVNSIVQLTENKLVNWRYYIMSSKMIHSLVHPHIKYPKEVANYYVNNLINESLEERKIALRIVIYVLKQQKREHIKVPIDPFAMNGLPSPTGFLKPGIRKDNCWLQYDVKTVPKTQEEWDEPRYVHKCRGFFGWPKDFSVYAPSSQQPNIDRQRDDMNDVEKEIYDFFAKNDNWNKLMEFWSVEEKKGKDKFNRTRFTLIKMICNSYGDSFLEHLLPIIKSRLMDSKNTDNNHRCVAEVISGIIRGAKHWSFEKTVNLYNELIPIIREALNNITSETDMYWGTCFATASEGTDPRRQYWLHETLMEDPIRETTSFIDCSRIYCLQGSFNQHVWRMNTVAHRLLKYFQPFLMHRFQNVRERLGSMLINIFEADLQFPGGSEPECPRIKDIITELLPKLQILLKDDTIKSKDDMDTSDDSALECNNEYDEAVRLFKTILLWIVNMLHRLSNGSKIEYFELLPFACRLERCEQDTELVELCTSFLAFTAQAFTMPDCFELALNKIYNISLFSSWSARLAVIDVLQVMVFHNMPIAISNNNWVEKIQVIVLNLLEDPVLDVREKSAQVLGGLIHCSLLPHTENLLKSFTSKCKTNLRKNGVGHDNDISPADAVRIRHSGVLGICAFIAAYPYDVPDFLPGLFAQLGEHSSDAQPILATIRKTVGDFKRTHHENWASHQLKFTEDQLNVLSDLTVPPSYYA